MTTREAVCSAYDDPLSLKQTDEEHGNLLPRAHDGNVCGVGDCMLTFRTNCLAFYALRKKK